MASFYIIILFVAVALCIAYVVLIASYSYAWIKLIPPVIKPDTLQTKVSVIIAARNEENTIGSCISSILQQSYPAGYFELIIVDDASEDATNTIIQQFCAEHKNIKLINIKPATSTVGKKNALNAAIKNSMAELIVTTDADCIMDKNWLSTIVCYYEQTKSKMIVAPVVFYDEKNSFEKMQTLEFVSLIASGAGSLYFNKATLCNGANLAYTREAFDEVGGFEGINQSHSGDDVLLMYKIKKKHPTRVKFLKHKDAIVYTKAKANLTDFVSQRKRWASKGFKTLNIETKIVAGIVYTFNLSLFFSITIGLFFKPVNPSDFFLCKISYILFGIKCLIDFLLLFLALSFFSKKKLLIYLLPEEIFYILYIVIIGLVGALSKYEWKGRKMN